MKLILAAGAMVLAAGAADAAVIRYDLAAQDLALEYLIDCAPAECVDYTDEPGVYARTHTSLPLHFVVDTDVLSIAGETLTFSASRYDTLPDGISNVANEILGRYVITFDESENIISWDVDLDTDGSVYHYDPAFMFWEITWGDNLGPDGEFGDQLMFYRYSSTETAQWTKTETPAPIPLPASGLLLAGALGMIGLRRRVS